MEITLQKFNYFPLLSEETNAYTADIHVNGKIIARVKNIGHGGCSSVAPIDRVMVEKAEAFLSSQPEPTNLEDYADDLAQDTINKKEILKTLKKLDKLAVRNLVMVDKVQLESFIACKASSLNYSTIRTEKPTSEYPQEVKEAIKKSTLKPGEVFYNKGW